MTRYQKIILNYLKNNFEPKKIYYFTDGAGNISRIKVALLISKLMKKISMFQQNGTSMVQLMAKVRVMTLGRI